MAVFYQFAELFSTFIEGLIVLTIISKLSKVRYNKKVSFILTFALAIAYTFIVTLLNKWKIFSFFTIIICILYTFIITKLTSTGSSLLRCTATMLSWFFIHSIDYLLFYVSAMIVSKSFDISRGISTLLSVGMPRSLFVIAVKITELLIFALLDPIYPGLHSLRKKYLYTLLTISTGSYIMMSLITSLIMSNSVLILQVSVILSLIFIVLSLITTILATFWSSKYQIEKNERNMMEITNELIEKNLKSIQSSQNLIRRQVHDFKNHIRTIDGMLEDGTKAKIYTEELLQASYISAKYCHSENEIINSIINCKIAEANAQEIKFMHKVLIFSPINIMSIDICAILSNQIDNAIEACAKISDDKPKEIKVEIWQRESFLFFKVTNTTAENPFNKEGQLISRKKDSEIHGFGIKNIRETASKYDGELVNKYKDGKFISVVSVVNTE